MKPEPRFKREDFKEAFPILYGEIMSEGIQTGMEKAKSKAQKEERVDPIEAQKSLSLIRSYKSLPLAAQKTIGILEFEKFLNLTHGGDDQAKTALMHWVSSPAMYPSWPGGVEEYYQFLKDRRSKKGKGAV